jgi:hypothetical protein
MFLHMIGDGERLLNPICSPHVLAFGDNGGLIALTSHLRRSITHGRYRAMDGRQDVLTGD